MAKRTIGKSKLSALIGSDSEDGRVAMPTPDSAAENMPMSSRPRGRPKAGSGKVTKPKTVQRRLSGKAAKGKRGKRPALADRTNQQNGNDTEEVDEFEDHPMVEDLSQDELEEAPKQIAKKTRGRKATTKPDKISKIPMESVELEIPETQDPVKSAAKKSTQGSKRSRTKAPIEIIEETSKVIPETQDAMELDVFEEESTHEPAPKEVVVNRTSHRSPVKSRQTSTTRARPGSGSDTERSDPAVRRKLGDLTRKFENLDLKYRNLREIGIKEAEHNFERLNKQSEEKTRGSHILLLGKS